MKRTGTLSLLGGLFFVSSAFAGGPGATCDALPRIMKAYHSEHVTKRPADEAFAKRVSDLFLRRLDPQKSVLLAHEAAALAARVEALALNKSGNCDLLDELVGQQRGWAQAMSAHVNTVVADPKLQIDRSIVIATDLDKRPFPKTKAEQTELRRQLIHWQLANYVASAETLEEAKRKLSKRYSLIAKRASEQTQSDLYSRFLDSYANAFDPHTTYFSNDALEDFRIGMKLSLEGIGATLRQRDGYTTVADIVVGGAADRQGQLKRKDKIVAVSQGGTGEAVDVVDMGLRDVVRHIRGKKGTVVKLRVVREGKKRPFHILITRDKIDLKEQAATLKWKTIKRDARDLKLAVLDLPSFYGGRGAARQADRDVARLLAEAKEQKADGLLLDLSSNSGGLLSHAVDIGGFFLREGPVVGVRGNDDRDLRDDDARVQWSGPMVVLTSRISASASEIVSGALKDYKRAVLVGDSRTFGKGTVQTMEPLRPPEGAMKVTIARFYRPNGESTQGKGVEVDITLPSLTDRSIFAESEQHYSLPGDTTPSFASSEVNRPGADQWLPVTDGLLKTLGEKSKVRVAASEKFKEILEKHAKFSKHEDEVRIAELLDEPKEKEEDEDDEALKKKHEQSAQVGEALEVLADLVVR
jgi:carboxyl-terminal processing protease